jgi:hypothetical protein
MLSIDDTTTSDDNGAGFETWAISPLATLRLADLARCVELGLKSDPG